jgi:hypothetical protein
MNEEYQTRQFFNNDNMIKLIDLLREDFADAAFHGYGMKPQQMRTSTCSTEWQNADQDSGCPQFSDSTKITKEDEQTAIEYLNKEDIKTLIAYSRGGAILLQALSKGAKKPNEVNFVAPAWMRQWPTIKLTGTEASGIKGFIMHGDSDDAVPLKHSVILSKLSKLPLYVVKGANHITILKSKQTPTAGVLIKDLNAAANALPDWGAVGKATSEQLKQQQDFSNTII